MVYSLTGLGACQEVGRSAFLLDFGEKFLLDYGVKLEPDTIEYPIEINQNIKAVILSHAHLDHSGLLPYFYETSKVLSFMTKPTLELADILWADSLKIAKFEGIDAKFSEAEIRLTHNYNFIMPYRKKVDVSENVSLELFDAGHILGSSLVKLTHKDKAFLYTGDFRIGRTQLHQGADTDFGNIDYLMLESTYGDRNHPNREETERRFCESVQDTVDAGGWAIVPAFAVGRSQEIVDILTKYNITAEIFLDGMSQKVSRVYLENSGLIKDSKGLRRGLEQVTWVKNNGVRKNAMKKPSVIITTSGMMQGGPVMGYVEKMYNDPKSKIHLTGYQVETTPGRELIEKGVLPVGEKSKLVKVNCKVEKYDFSAHASQDELITMVKRASPKEIFMVHGDKDTMPIFAKKIFDETGIKATTPIAGKKINFE